VRARDWPSGPLQERRLGLRQLLGQNPKRELFSFSRNILIAYLIDLN
jgi:hypothetical protein